MKNGVFPEVGHPFFGTNLGCISYLNQWVSVDDHLAADWVERLVAWRNSSKPPFPDWISSQVHISSHILILLAGFVTDTQI